MSDQITRRELVVSGGIAFLATASNAQSSAAKTVESNGMSETEKANVKLFREWQAAWDQPNLDIDGIMAKYIAANASIRLFEDEPVAVGPEAAAVIAKKGAGNNLRIQSKIVKVLARGPLVATSRVDTIKIPGQPDEVVKLAGVCIIKDGKIQEYCDYIVT